MSVTKILKHYSQHSTTEQWIAETEAELRSEFANHCLNWPVGGYGTTMQNVKRDPTGLIWTAQVSRLNCCD